MNPNWYKSGLDNLEIVYDSWCKIIIYILGVNYWELVEMVLFIPPNNFCWVEKLHCFRKKFLRTQRVPKRVSQSRNFGKIGKNSSRTIPKHTSQSDGTWKKITPTHVSYTHIWSLQSEVEGRGQEKKLWQGSWCKCTKDREINYKSG